MISIIVPVYNAEKFLPQCLDSLVNQTYKEIEVICVNDGSTDGSLSILEQYAAKDTRVKVISQENQGPSEARNNGISKAEGEWMMFVDSDDWLEMDCCEQVMAQNDCDLVFFSYIREFKSTSALKYIFGMNPVMFQGSDIEWLHERLIAPNGEELKSPSNLDCLSTVWGKLYKTRIVREHQITFISTEKTGTLEDLMFNDNYFKYLHRAYYLPSCLYHYRKTKADSLAYSYKPNLPHQWEYVFDEIKKRSDGMKQPWMSMAVERRKALCLFGLGLNIVFSKQGWSQEIQMLSEILRSDWYVAAIYQLDTKPMPLHWRCFYVSARHQKSWAVLVMVKIINLIINR